MVGKFRNNTGSVGAVLPADDGAEGDRYEASLYELVKVNNDKAGSLSFN